MKNKHFIGILTPSGNIRFVTDLDHQTKTWAIDMNKSPLLLTKSVAESTAEAICFNGISAFVMSGPCMINEQLETMSKWHAANIGKDAAIVGARAAYMHSKGLLEIGGSVVDEAILGTTCYQIAKTFWDNQDDVLDEYGSFDAYIETKLIKMFGKERNKESV